MKSDLKCPSLVGDLNNVPPLNVLIWQILTLIVVYRDAPAAVANGYDTPLCVAGQELVLAVAWQVLGNLEELQVGLSRGVASLSLVNNYHLGLIVTRLYGGGG